MPDHERMDHLGPTLRCIDCGMTFRPWQHAERTAHYRAHERERRSEAAKRRRENVKRLKQMTRLRREARELAR